MLKLRKEEAGCVMSRRHIVDSVADTVFSVARNESHDKFTFQHFNSRNRSMRRLFDVMTDIAPSDATVFLHGERGVGKELFARAIHDFSLRRNGPLVIVNCGALPESLLDAEIFGVRKGASPGATDNRAGQLELCNAGTLFLDEIGDLTLPLQLKLLRVMENNEFQPFGAKKPMKTDVRFIIATHRNLAAMVKEGTFLRDLFSRINPVELNIPPLRERKEDIPLLLEMAINKSNLAYGKKVQCVSPEVLKLLLHHDFPGNVRELQKLIDQAVSLCKGSEIGLGLMPVDYIQDGTIRNTTTSHSPLHLHPF